jgi:hypothetical protein
MQLRHLTAFSAALFAATAFNLPQTKATPLLAVDFGAAGESPQSGFTAMSGDSSQATASGTFGAYTVDLEGQGFGRGSAGHNGLIPEANRSLYRDYYYNNSDINGEGVKLSIGGVVPNASYNLTLWSYDPDQFFSSTDTTWSPTGGSSGTSGFVTDFADPPPATLSDYSTTIQVSSATSTLEIFGTTTSGSGGTRLNGFTLNNGTSDVLSIDLGQPLAAPSPVEPGFNGMAGAFPLGPNSPPPSLTSTFGAYKVTVSGDPYHGTDYSRVGFEDTAAGAAGIDASIRPLYEDAFFNNLDLNDGSGLTLAIQGVTPGKQYQVKLWSYNADNTIYSTPTQFGPLAGSSTTGTSGTVTQFATPLPATADDYSTTIIVSSTTNTLQIHGASTSNFGGTRLNGFELSELAPPRPGDFNGDGSVNAADLTAWKAHFGTSTGATLAMGDADGDHDVDGADFLVWQKNVGPASVSAVPEPAVAPLLAGLLSLGGLFRRKRVG